MWAGGKRADDCAHDTKHVSIGYHSPVDDVVIYFTSEHDEALLQRLSNNDPSVARLSWGFGQNQDRYPELADKAGGAIGQNRYLRALHFGSCYHTTADWLTSFFTRVAENRSIERFQMNEFDHRRAGVDVCKILTPFFVHNINLR